MHPRPYLSHSQKKLWKRSPDEYLKKYLFEKSQFVTKEMKFGSKMAQALEDDELTGDPLLDTVIQDIPKFEMMDVDTEVNFEILGDVIPLFGRMDSMKADYSGFKEYKTGKDGKGGWNQMKVDNDSQITFYATMCYLLTKKIPNDIELVWIITEGDPLNDKGIICTGEMRRFKTKRNMSQIINELADIRKVWCDIGDRYVLELL